MVPGLLAGHLLFSSSISEALRDTIPPFLNLDMVTERPMRAPGFVPF
jgi:hypothetical protein